MQELHALQGDVVSWGHESFSSFPLVYLQVLLLTQQFEQAVAYWWDPKAPQDQGDQGTVDRTRGVEAIHLALALMDTHRKGGQELLHVKPSSADPGYSDLLVSCGNGEWEIEICPLLEQFTKQFQYHDPKLAMYYLAMFPDSHRRKRIDSIVALAVETREYSRLFLTKKPRRNPLGPNQIGGYSDDCGLQEGGELERLLSYARAPEDALAIMDEAARQATGQGHWEDAIDLYMTSRQYAKAVDTLTEQLEQNYSQWSKGSRNQILIERAHRILLDEGLCQGPAGTPYQGGTGMMDMGGAGEQDRRTMQESVRSLQKLYTVARFFDAFEKGEQARIDFEKLEEELARANHMHIVSADQYSLQGHPLRQKREQVQLFYKNALAMLAESPYKLLPVFLNAPGQFIHAQGEYHSTPAISRMVEECRDEYQNELRVGVQGAVREMLGPVCDMQRWLYTDEERCGHPSTKATHKEVLKMTNGALKEFSTIQAVRSGLATGIADKVRDLFS